MVHYILSKRPTTHTQAPEVLVCGWWGKGKHDGGRRAKQVSSHMLTWKSKLAPLRSPNRFCSKRITLFWIGMFYHVLPCATMWNYVLWNVKCLELCKFFCGNEWIQIVLKLFVALKAWLPGALHFYQSAPPPTHKHQRCLCVGGGAKASMMGGKRTKKWAATC